MIEAEFKEIRRILQGRYKLFEDQLDVFRWFEGLKAYDFAVVKEAVNDWIVNDGWRPEVVNIEERCKDVLRWKKQIQAAAPQNPNIKTVACPYCHDSGLIIKTYPTGAQTAHHCTHCLTGRNRFPWDFLSEEEKREYNEREIKAGRSVPSYHYAPEEFRKAYLYGENKAKQNETTKQPLQKLHEKALQMPR